MIIGRKTEQQRLNEINDAPEAQFVAVYGRRRVGKTFLIKEFFKEKADLFFSVTGLLKGTRQQQLGIFRKEFEAVFSNESLPSPLTWPEAFDALYRALRTYCARNHPKSVVVFLDELPWLDGKRRQLLSALDHSWNTQLSNIPSLRLIVCGSAASWMIKNIINAKGGLHNRPTASIRLLPFTFNEANEFFRSRQFDIDPFYALDLYLTFGGVPHYLKLLSPHLSVAQSVERLCFGNGELVDEFHNLYSSLFTHSEFHERIVRLLAQHSFGLTRGNIAKAARLSQSGKLTLWLEELNQAGFVEKVVSYGKKSRDARYRLVDEFSLFSQKWQHPRTKTIFEAQEAEGTWQAIAQSAAYRSWRGYAFENFCLKHHFRIKKALGFEAVQSTAAPWWNFSPSEKQEEKCQIDLLFDRADGVITLCEIKYAEHPYNFTKVDQEELLRKRQVFVEHTGTRKQVVFALITPWGVKESALSRQFLSKVVSLNDFL